MFTPQEIRSRIACRIVLFLAVGAPLCAGDDPLGIPLQPTGNVPELKVLKSTEYVIPSEGRSVIVNKVEAPEIVSPPEILKVSPSEATFARRAAAAAAWKALNHRQMMLSCTVHDGVATLVRWYHKGTEYRAWSNVNFHHFAGINYFASADGQTRYTLMLGIGDASVRGVAGNRPVARAGDEAIPPIPADGPGFVLVQGDPANSDALADMRALHEKYRQEGAALKAAWEQREQTARERAAWLKAHPPVPQDITIFYSDIQNGKSGAKGEQP